jgi:hypothetical protein
MRLRSNWLKRRTLHSFAGLNYLHVQFIVTISAGFLRNSVSEFRKSLTQEWYVYWVNTTNCRIRLSQIKSDVYWALIKVLQEFSSGRITRIDYFKAMPAIIATRSRKALEGSTSFCAAPLRAAIITTYGIREQRHGTVSSYCNLISWWYSYIGTNREVPKGSKYLLFTTSLLKFLIVQEKSL